MNLKLIWVSESLNLKQFFSNAMISWEVNAYQTISSVSQQLSQEG